MKTQGKSIPRPWRKVRIEEIFAPLEDGRTMHQGWSPQCEKQPSRSEKDWGVLRTTSIQPGEFQPEHNKLLPSKLEPRPLLEVKPGDILITCAGPRIRCGISCLVENTRGRLMISGKMYRFRTRPDEVSAKYVVAFLQSEDAAIAIDGMKTGGSESGLNLTHERFRQLLVPMAPLSEQRRIVGILDEAFEGLATAKANAEQNLQNARALFESHLQAVFTHRGDGWDRMTLETLLERGWIEDHMDGNHGGDYPRKEEFISEGVPYISANCLDGERVDMSRAKYLSPSRAALLRKGFAKDNDVLFAHNATVGPVTILHTDEEKVILGTSLTYYRCNRAHILPEYLAHYMRSFGFKTQYLQVMRQSTRNQVPITKQREFFHVVPPLDEQKAIIGQLDGLLDNGQRLESLYQRKLAALDELKKSLLHRAFSGQL